MPREIRGVSCDEPEAMWHPNEGNEDLNGESQKAVQDVDVQMLIRMIDFKSNIAECKFWCIKNLNVMKQ